MNILGKKKNHKKEPHPSPLTPPSMESDDLDPSTILFHQLLPTAARRSDHVWGAVPSPVRLAVDWLNKKGLNEEGIYRVPGKATTFATYKALFDRGVEFDFFELHEMAPENVAMVLIKYLQALPDPIYSAKFEAHFKLALAIQNEQERATVMRGIMYMIPLAYRETCRVLVDHLKLVAGNSDVNKMTIRNVELTWSLSVGQMTGAVVRVLSESPFPVPSTLQYHVPLALAIENTPREMTTERYLVPYAVSRLVAYLKENDAFSTPLLFSTEPKSIEVLEDIIYVLNGGSLGVDGAFPAEMSVIYASSALKQWISDVPGDTGLFPDAMCPDFVHVIPPSSADSKPINYSQLPEKLEHLVWKLPDTHLETIKALLDVLRTWTTFAPEDMTCIQAVELLFIGYPLPLQHVLAYLLFNYDMLFGAGDSALTAHLQSLVFASPGAAPAPGGFASPLSPRHLAFNNKPAPSSPVALPISAATGASSANGAQNGTVDSGSVSPRAGISPPSSSTTPPTSATAASVASAAATATSAATNLAGEDQIGDFGSGSAAVGADATSTDASDHAVSSATSKRDAKATQEAPEAGQEKPTVITPSKAYKKSKTLKAGTSPLTPGKIKKHKEAEDGTPTKKSKTPKSAKGTPKTDTKGLDSPTPLAQASLDIEERPRSRHTKSTSADVESPVSERRRTPKRRDISDPSSPSTVALSRSASSDHASSSNQDSSEKPEKQGKSENSTDSPSTTSTRTAKRSSKDSPSTPNTHDSSSDHQESQNGKESKTKNTASPAPSHSLPSSEEHSTPTKTQEQTTDKPKSAKRAKAVSSPAAAQTVSSTSSEPSDTTKKAHTDPLEQDKLSDKPSKPKNTASTTTGGAGPIQPAEDAKSHVSGDVAPRSEQNGKKKEQRKSKIEDSPAGSDDNDSSADGSTPNKTTKRKSLGGAATGPSEKKSERRKSKPQNLDSLTSQEEEPSFEDAPSTSVDPSAKKTRKAAVSAEEGTGNTSSPKKTRIKVTTPAEPTETE